MNYQTTFHTFITDGTLKTLYSVHLLTSSYSFPYLPPPFPLILLLHLPSFRATSNVFNISCFVSYLFVSSSVLQLFKLLSTTLLGEDIKGSGVLVRNSLPVKGRIGQIPMGILHGLVINPMECQHVNAMRFLRRARKYWPIQRSIHGYNYL